MSTKVTPQRLDSTKDFSSLVPSAYDKANSAGSFANGAFDRANSAYAQANNSTDTWVRTQANNAYDTANSSGVFANGAFLRANSSYTAQNTTASFANSAFDRANAAYAKANTGVSSTSNSVLLIAVSDETSNIAVGNSKMTFRAPTTMNLISIPRATLTANSTSGVVNVDIKLAGTTILGTNKITIDASNGSSKNATTPTTLVTTTIPDDGTITIDILAAGTQAKGLKIALYYN